MKEKAIFCWSGGKDSALCLHRVLQESKYEIVSLLTNVNEHYRRITMHGVSEELLDQQAKSIGLPLEKLYLSQTPDNNEYERKTEEILLKFKAGGVTHVIFGDIFLEDLRAYRENGLQKIGLQGVYPLWISAPADYRKETEKLFHEFIDLGFKSVTCCVNDALGEGMAGRLLDTAFLADLPSSADPCGENGEYHSFAFDGPIFKHPIPVKAGEKVYRPLEIKTDGASVTKGFWYCELHKDTSRKAP